jgi:large subunit ribosomal protein L24e
MIRKKLVWEEFGKMPKCVYCGKMYEFPRGLTFVKNDGSVNYFCSSKCLKNYKMKRRKVRWVLKSKKLKENLKEELKSEVKSEEKK